MAEVYTVLFTTSLAVALTTTSRPTTISVSATQAALGGGTFSCAIYDAGTDANPVHFEAFEITAGGATTTWTINTEVGYTPLTHVIGSTVIATVLTPRALSQPLTDHTTPATTPDPHSVYLLKSNFFNKGDLLAGSGVGTFVRVLAGQNGSTLLTDNSQPGGIRWVSSFTTLFTQTLPAVASMVAIGSATSESPTAPALVTSGTILTAGMFVTRVAPAGAVTSVVLQAWVAGNPSNIIVINESVAASSITFAAANSNVADANTSPIAGLTARAFTWDVFTGLWYRSA